MARKGFAGAAVITSITATMTPSSPAESGTFDISDATGWAFTALPFVVVIDRGLATEEKLLCSGISGTTLTVQQRGFDGTTAQDHESAAEIIHVLDSETIDELNAHANDGHDGGYLWMVVSP